jgi:hypothetical protein
MSEAIELTVVMNALNRSMGQPDAYPFAISEPIKEKLHFVHALVQEASQTETPRTVDDRDSEVLLASSGARKLKGTQSLQNTT